MLFGQSVFQSVISRLEREAEDASDEDDAPGFRSSIFGPNHIYDAPAGSVSQGIGKDRTPLSLYLELLEDPPAPVQPEPPPIVMPDYLARTSLEQVSAELSISDNDTPESLGEKRRAFARLNHPDAVADAFRHNAHLRMTAANLLIDQAIRLIQADAKERDRS